jgi:hypothetical protein
MDWLKKLSVPLAGFGIPLVVQAFDAHPDGFWRLFILAALWGFIILGCTYLTRPVVESNPSAGVAKPTTRKARVSGKTGGK